jgi:hypothetical protein
MLEKHMIEMRDDYSNLTQSNAFVHDERLRYNDLLDEDNENVLEALLNQTSAKRFMYTYSFVADLFQFEKEYDEQLSESQSTIEKPKQNLPIVPCVELTAART